MIGRLDAPGAKLEPVMPGFENSTSPKVESGLRWISSFGTTSLSQLVGYDRERALHRRFRWRAGRCYRSGGCGRWSWRPVLVRERVSAGKLGAACFGHLVSLATTRPSRITRKS